MATAVLCGLLTLVCQNFIKALRRLTYEERITWLRWLSPRGSGTFRGVTTLFPDDRRNVNPILKGDLMTQHTSLEPDEPPACSPHCLSLNSSGVEGAVASSKTVIVSRQPGTGRPWLAPALASDIEHRNPARCCQRVLPVSLPRRPFGSSVVNCREDIVKNGTPRCCISVCARHTRVGQLSAVLRARRATGAAVR